MLEFSTRPILEDGVELVTTASFSVLLNGDVIWPKFTEDSYLEIQIDDILSHFAENWVPILVGQTYPLGLNPARPSELRSMAERRWANLPNKTVAEEDVIIEQFADAHDFTRCFAGSYDVQPFWLMHSLDNMIIDTGYEYHILPFKDVVSRIEDLCIAFRNRLSYADHGRWSSLIDAWDSRNEAQSAELIRASTGLSADSSLSLMLSGLLQPPLTVSEAANDDDELRIAARMANSLPLSQIRNILSVLSTIHYQHAPKMDDASGSISSHIRENSQYKKPFEQGSAAACHLRELFEIDSYSFIEIFDFVRRLGVTVLVKEMSPNTLDALAIWGTKHGPAVVINESSRRHKEKIGVDVDGGLRVTLAHELCHLLIDRHHALGVVDVLHSRMPIRIEQRAKAFAASFLLPAEAAFQIWYDHGQSYDKDTIESLLQNACMKYKVTRSAAAWQIEHGILDKGYNVSRISEVLYELVPHR